MSYQEIEAKFQQELQELQATCKHAPKTVVIMSIICDECGSVIGQASTQRDATVEDYETLKEMCNAEQA